MDRRQFVRRSGLTALGASALLGGAWSRLLTAAMADPGLLSRRRATYRALVVAASQAPGTLVDGRRADEALGTLADWYDQQDPSAQTAVDAVLDALERGPSSGGFSELRPAEGYGFLRSWALERDPGERAHERDLVAAVYETRLERPATTRAAFRAFLDARAAEIRANVARIAAQQGADALALDPQTGLQRYVPPPPVSAPPPPPTQPGSVAALHRYVAGTALELAGIPFYDESASPPL
jgi:hypothetical protein